MEFLQLEKTRYSVRKFTSQKVVKEKLDAILKAAQIAPTACNKQPFKLLVIESDEALKKLKDCTVCHFDAPLAILICGDKNESWTRTFDNKPHSDIDASIVTTYMMLQISNLGLGSTWVCHFDPKAIKETYNIPDNLEPISLLPIGYPSSDSEPNPRHFERKNIKDITVYNKF